MGAELITKEGHDLLMNPRIMPAFENEVIDHREIYDECELKYGKPIDLAIKNTYNPKTKKYFGFSPIFIPHPVNYRRDLWDSVGVFPNTWDDVRVGGRKLKQEHGKSLWINFSTYLHTIPFRSIMNGFGASIQDEEGNLVLNSKQTLEAVKFVKALCEEAVTEDVFHWEDIHCDFPDKFMLSGDVSLLLNSISVTRTAERDNPEISRKIQLARAPKGPIQRIGQSITPIYCIWEFSENIEGAKQFLIDYVGNLRKVFLVSKFRDFPCFPDTVPDLNEIIVNDSRGDPPTKYNILKDVLSWSTNTGYPGYANAAIEEIISTHVITNMFRQVATGSSKPDDAIRDAEIECKLIFSGWRSKGLV